MKALDNIRSSIKELGALNYALYCLDISLNRLSRGRIRIIKYYFYSQPVNPDPIVKNTDKRSIKIFRIDRSDEIVQQFPRPAPVIHSRYDQKSICYAAIKEGRFVGYIWFTEGPYLEDEVKCRFSPIPEGQAAWDYDIYIEPKYRLGLAFQMLWDAANMHLYKNGFRWSNSRISAYNSTSMQVHKKLGAIRVGSASFVVIGTLQLVISSIFPRLQISITSLPQLKIPSGHHFSRTE